MPERPLPGSSFPGRCRKLLIVAIFVIILGRVVMLNVGVSLDKIGARDLASPFTRPVPSLDALLLRQQWSLFTDISPFNYTTHFEVTMEDGSTVPVRFRSATCDRLEERSLYMRTKIQNNLSCSPQTDNVAIWYLIRRNRIDPSQIEGGVIFIRYRNLLKRDEAAAAGTYYGPEIRYDLFRF
jgi:hypothetical protein